MPTPFTEEEQRLLDLLRTNPDFLAAVRQQVLSPELLQLPQQVAEIAQNLAELSLQFHAHVQETNRRLAILEEQAIETNRRLAILEEQAIETNRRLESLGTDVAGLKTNVTGLKTDVSKLQSDVANLYGSDLERRARENILNIARDAMGLTYGRILMLKGAEANSSMISLIQEAEDQQKISESEASHLVVADIIIQARRSADRQQVHAVFEVSRTMRNGDIQRAHDRAATLAKITDTPVLAAVVGERIQPPQIDLARRQNVTVVIPAMFSAHSDEADAADPD